MSVQALPRRTQQAIAGEYEGCWRAQSELSQQATRVLQFHMPHRQHVCVKRTRHTCSLQAH